MSILIKNATVLTMDKRNEVLENTCVLIEGKYIKYVGPYKSVLKADKEIDANGNLLMPGLINAHTHVSMTLLRNYADDMNLEKWLFEYIFPIEDRFTPEDIYNGAIVGMMEMIASGTTSYIDMYFHEDQVAEATLQTGMRALLGFGLQNNKIEQRINNTKMLWKRYNGQNDGCIQTVVSPHSVYTNDTDSLLEFKKLIPTTNNVFQIHLNESETEVNNCLKLHGKTPIEYLESLGYYEHKGILAHVDNINDKEIEILKNKDLTLVMNPCSNLKLASGIMPVQKLLSSGLNVALGTDGPSSNNSLDMFETMKFASLLAKIVDKNPENLNAWDTIKMATVNGAKALGLENELGKVKENYLADLILVDLNTIHNSPKSNVISSIVYSLKSSDVYTTIINGKIVYENKQFVSLNKDEAITKLQQSFQRITSK
ncbi:amidohydrolase [Mycoplasmopsis felifaucium]|uniref:5-methylthioadenosine/S-adenosylhomocysteine deaminase n=1 Tax=Mycoplasmopsis felifaucium TaxID=35768 RepID=A0ABZ2RRB2_9BACT